VGIACQGEVVVRRQTRQQTRQTPLFINHQQVASSTATTSRAASDPYHCYVNLLSDTDDEDDDFQMAIRASLTDVQYVISFF